VENGGVYRNNEETDGYLIAFSDAGRALRVQPSFGGQLLAQADPKSGAPAQPSWTVSLLLLQRTLTSGSYDRLPPPAQALRIFQEGEYASEVPTWGKSKGHIRINSDAIK
jgi:hypothetical protein